MREEGRAKLPDAPRGAVEISRHRKETLGPKEPPIGYLRQPTRAKRRREFPAHLLERIRMIDRPIAFAAPRFVISGPHPHPLKQRRLSGPVLADDDGDRAIQAQFKVVLKKRQAKWIGL